MKNTWQMCLASKLRQIVAAFFILVPLIETTASLCIQKEFPTNLISDTLTVIPFVLACGSGCIGRQLNDGTLSLVLSRPLKISSYAFSKWFAVAIAAAVASLIQLVAEVIVASFRTPYLLDPGFVLTNGIERVLVCLGFSAVFMFFSSLVSGSKDLAVFLVSYLTAQVCAMLAQIRPETLPEGIGRIAASLLVPPIGIIAQVLQFVLKPEIDLSETLNNVPLDWTAVSAYLSVLAVFSALCIYSLNRRELPYGAD